MSHQEMVEKALAKGATHAAPVRIVDMKLYPSLREMCSMNSCGAYATNWGCPPGCGEVDKLIEMVSRHKEGVVFQYIGQLEDSFDFENMTASAAEFAKIATGLKEELQGDGILVLGAGHCHICEKCTYPDAPCRFPEKCTIPVEACGINVSELCALAGLNYINGENTVTYSGLIALP